MCKEKIIETGICKNCGRSTGGSLNSEYCSFACIVAGERPKKNIMSLCDYKKIKGGDIMRFSEISAENKQHIRSLIEDWTKCLFHPNLTDAEITAIIEEGIDRAKAENRCVCVVLAEMLCLEDGHDMFCK